MSLYVRDDPVKQAVADYSLAGERARNVGKERGALIGRQRMCGGEDGVKLNVSQGNGAKIAVGHGGGLPVDEVGDAM